MVRVILLYLFTLISAPALSESILEESLHAFSKSYGEFTKKSAFVTSHSMAGKDLYYAEVHYESSYSTLALKVFDGEEMGRVYRPYVDMGDGFTGTKNQLINGTQFEDSVIKVHKLHGHYVHVVGDNIRSKATLLHPTGYMITIMGPKVPADNLIRFIELLIQDMHQT